MTTHSKETSDRIAHLAAVVLAKRSSSHQEKELAGSVLAQVRRLKQSEPAR